MRDEVLDYDPVFGIKRTLKWDDAERKLIVENVQDATDALAWNRALFNAERATSSLWGGRSMVKVASIPNIVIEQWRKEGMDILHDKAALAKAMARLSTNEYSAFRTAPGRLA